MMQTEGRMNRYREAVELARCFPTPRWFWVFFILIAAAVGLHLFFMIAIGFIYEPLLAPEGTPWDPPPRFWHNAPEADGQLAWGYLILALLVWLHLLVGMWLWILAGIHEWTIPRLPRRPRTAVLSAILAQSRKGRGNT